MKQTKQEQEVDIIGFYLGPFSKFFILGGPRPWAVHGGPTTPKIKIDLNLSKQTLVITEEHHPYYAANDKTTTISLADPQGHKKVQSHLKRLLGEHNV